MHQVNRPLFHPFLQLVAGVPQLFLNAPALSELLFQLTSSCPDLLCQRPVPETYPGDKQQNCGKGDQHPGLESLVGEQGPGLQGNPFPVNSFFLPGAYLRQPLCQDTVQHRPILARAECHPVRIPRLSCHAKVRKSLLFDVIRSGCKIFDKGIAGAEGDFPQPRLDVMDHVKHDAGILSGDELLYGISGNHANLHPVQVLHGERPLDLLTGDDRCRQLQVRTGKEGKFRTIRGFGGCENVDPSTSGMTDDLIPIPQPDDPETYPELFLNKCQIVSCYAAVSAIGAEIFGGREIGVRRKADDRMGLEPGPLFSGERVNAPVRGIQREKRQDKQRNSYRHDPGHFESFRLFRNTVGHHTSLTTRVPPAPARVIIGAHCSGWIADLLKFNVYNIIISNKTVPRNSVQEIADIFLPDKKNRSSASC